MNSTRWRADIRQGGVKVYLGSFDDKTLAAAAYDKAALMLRGKGVLRLNFSLSNYLDADGQIIRDQGIMDRLAKKGCVRSDIHAYSKISFLATPDSHLSPKWLLSLHLSV